MSFPIICSLYSFFVYVVNNECMNFLSPIIMYVNTNKLMYSFYRNDIFLKILTNFYSEGLKYYFSIIGMLKSTTCINHATKVVAKFNNLSISGALDTVKTAKTLLENESVFQDVMLLHDEIYVQKSDEYVGGMRYGTDTNGQFYEGVVCFMSVGIKSNVPYIIRSVPEIEIKGNWLKEEILRVTIF